MLPESNGLKLTEYAPGETVESLRECTAAPFTVCENLKEMLQ